MSTVFIQNIVSPYRARFFNSLAEQDESFATYYLSKTEADRNWDLSKISMEHNHWIDRWGIYFMLKGFHIHINPVLICKTLFSRKIKNVILCVSYCDVSIIALCLAKKIRLTKKRYFFWAEANYLTNGARKESSFKKRLRSWVFSTVDGAMVIPGKMSEITFAKWGIPVERFIQLPNTIDDNAMQFVPNNTRAENKLPVFIIPIRIIESLKGALNFFDAIREENVKKAKFVIAGDGEDKKMYEEYILKNGYSEHIELAGFCDADRMKELYNTANALLLPSFSDPSPLTLVEALKFHLPILCSNHCGNHFETVESGKNGYTFSPLDTNEIKSQFELFMSRRDEWATMGEVSAQLYKERFDTELVIRRFIEQFNKEKID